MKRKDLKVGDVFRYKVDVNNGIMGWLLVADDKTGVAEAKERGCFSVSTEQGSIPDEEVELKTEPQSESKPLIAQPHYVMKPEPVEAIEGWGYANNWYRANAIAYLARAGKKENVSAESDLLKAITFIVREITGARGEPSWDPSSVIPLINR